MGLEEAYDYAASGHGGEHDGARRPEGRIGAFIEKPAEHAGKVADRPHQSDTTGPPAALGILVIMRHEQRRQAERAGVAEDKFRGSPCAGAGPAC